MIIVDYDYYKNEYKSNLSEDDFNKFYRKSYILVDNMCYGRVSKGDESDFDSFTVSKIKDCICEVIDKIHSVTNSDGVIEFTQKASESVGPWSISYDNSNKSSSSNSYLGIISSIVYSYLGNTNLMCAWVY